MKEVMYYNCEKCGHIYEDKERCNRCENSHEDMNNIEIAKVKFLQNNSMPVYITLRHKETGAEYDYTRI